MRKESRSRSREKSSEKEDRRTKTNSPYLEGRVGRVSRDDFTDKDSDDLDRDNVRELEKDYLAAKEKSKAIKEKLEKEYKRTRRVRTGNTGGLFREEMSQDQYAQMEREFARGQSRTLRRIKETSSPSSRGAARKSHWQSPGRGGRNPNSTYKESEDNIEHEDMVGSGDFRGMNPKDMERKLRRILKRIKSNMISDPVMKGKIMNTTGLRWARI